MKKPSPRIWLEPIKTAEHVAASFLVKIAGLPVGKKLTLDFFEVDPPGGKTRDEKRNQQSGDVQLGTIAATVAANPLMTKISGVPSFTLVPEDPAPAAPTHKADVVEFRFQGCPDRYQFSIPNEALDLDEGDYWEIQVRSRAPKIVSPILTVAHVRRVVGVDKSKYAWLDGNDLELYHDGAEDPDGAQGAFADLKKAIDQAKKFIFVVDWSFQPYVKLNLNDGLDKTIGALLLKKADAGVTVAIHTWNHTTHFASDPQNDDANKWMRELAGHAGVSGMPAKLLWRASSPDLLSLSHHQKFVVMDQPATDGRLTVRAFFGGLDLTQGRLDWPKHPTRVDDSSLGSRRLSWGTSPSHLTNEWYNGETSGNLDLPREPWHDIYGHVDGPTAWDFVREFVIRWAASLHTVLGDKLRSSGDPVCDVWKMVRNPKDWVQASDHHEGPWTAQLLRSTTKKRCAVAAQFAEPEAEDLKKVIPSGTEASIQAMYDQAISQAEWFIYIENQYLIGSGDQWRSERKTVDNHIPQRIVDKILSKKGQPFHVYVVTPMFPEGDPVSAGSLDVRNYEWKTIRYLVEKVSNAVGPSWTDYLTFLFLADWHAVPQKQWAQGKRKARLKAHQRYMVYVHSKMMIVDDRFLLLGSANLNERSLAGDRDTEIACAFWPGRNQEKTCIDKLSAFRKKLFTEHFGKLPQNADDPASAQCIQDCQDIADANYLAFRSLAADRQGNACRFPIKVANGEFTVGIPTELPKGLPSTPEPLMHLPDSDGKNAKWRWTCDGTWLPTGKAPE
jgi:phospholipase D1/2